MKKKEETRARLLEPFFFYMQETSEALSVRRMQQNQMNKRDFR